MSAPVDLLAYHDGIVESHRALSSDAYHAQQLPKAIEVRAAVAELMAKSRDLEVAANGVAYCYAKNPARFAENLQNLSEAAAEYRAALAACGVAK